MRAMLIGAMLAGLVTVQAAAQERGVRLSHEAIAAGDFDRAERHLIAERRIYPDNAELLLNLAAVYANTGRSAQAASLYHQVLAQPDVLMDLSEARTAGSHALAELGLRRMGREQTAAR